MGKKPKKKVSARVRVISSREPEPALPIVQHAFKNTMECLFDPPTAVLISKEAYERMWHFVDVADDEVGWLGTVKELPRGGFLIEEVFLLHQEVTGATTEISEEGVSRLADELLRREDGLEAVNKLRFWGHSHVMMGTSPSYQDERQMDMFRDNDCEWFIRAILNKRGRMEIDIFYFDSQIMFKDVPWIVYNPVTQEIREEILAEFGEKVTKRVYAPTHVGFRKPDQEDWSMSGFPVHPRAQFGGAEFVSEGGVDESTIEEIRKDLEINGMTVDDLSPDTMPREVIRKLGQGRE